MSAIVDRLRDRAYGTKAGDPLCEEAANDITRLRWRLKIRENVIARLVAENQRLRNGVATASETVCPHVRGTVTQHCSLNLTLTDEEREAIYRAEARLRTAYVPDDETAATLRNLLARLS